MSNYAEWIDDMLGAAKEVQNPTAIHMIECCGKGCAARKNMEDRSNGTGTTDGVCSRFPLPLRRRYHLSSVHLRLSESARKPRNDAPTDRNRFGYLFRTPRREKYGRLGFPYFR